MKKHLLLFFQLLVLQTFAQNSKISKNNFQLNFITGNTPLNLNRVIDNIYSAGYSEGKTSKSKIGFGAGFDLNVNKFELELGFSFNDLTTQNFTSTINNLNISSTAISLNCGRNFWATDRLKINLSAGPYFQEVSLNIKPTNIKGIQPNSLVDFLANPSINLKEYSIASGLGGLSTQVKFNYFFLPKQNRKGAFQGLSIFASINYRNQLFDKGNWRFSASQGTNSNNNNSNNSSNATTLKFPNKHDFDSSGLMFSIGLGFHTSYLGKNTINNNFKLNP